MQSVRASTLIPRGFVVDDAVNDVDGTLITMRPIGAASLCPACGATFGTEFTVDILGVLRICPLRAVGYVSCFLRGVSAAVQFSAGGAFSLNVLTQTSCALGAANGSARPYRASSRARFGRSPGGELCTAFDVAGSNDTLLRLVRRRGAPRFVPPTVLGSTTGHGGATSAMGRSFAI